MSNRTVHGGLFAVVTVAIAVLATPGAPATAQEPERRTDCPDCEPSNTLSAEPRVFHTQEQTFRVVPMKGLNRPWALEFLPNGDMLITEHGGELRIVRDGALDPEPLAGIPEVFTPRRKGLMDIALHPRFEQNQFVYFTYHKASPKHRLAATTVLARGKFEGRGALVEVRDLFVADADYMGAAQTSRIIFGPDGKLYMVVGQPARYEVGSADYAQDPSNHAGKMLRLNDDGSGARRQSVRRIPRATDRRSTPSASATRTGWRGTRRPASCGRPRTGRRAATRSTSSARAATTAGRSSPTGGRIRES